MRPVIQFDLFLQITKDVVKIKSKVLYFLLKSELILEASSS